ncbi:LysE family translocator [Salinarimonas soli]|uniref:LysE family translocator n=1 Tax=Salinarimonas soli TaxID=1638099 RepID=A0A5B2VEP3_9HYPH|nr:LysE family translocator [Salinarimonas soli]KAA2237464.1 LysE family translocator [Salinarimonas soli]
MPLDLYLAFVAAVVVLILVPGPNVALIVANSVAHGVGYGLLTMAGTSSAMVLQLAVAVGGMTALLAWLAAWFEALRWVGVAYLAYLGWRAWTAPPHDLTGAKAQPRSGWTIYGRGVLVSLANPKTLLFYGAFLPQFVDPAGDATGQLVLLAATFLGLAVVLDGAWALLAARVAGVLAARGRLRQRITGGLLMGAAAGLALVRRP